MNSKTSISCSLLFSIALSLPAFSSHTPKTTKQHCLYISELNPDAAIRPIDKDANWPHTFSKYELLYKSKPIKDLYFSRFQGYGTRRWWHGIKSHHTGGEIIIFNENYPIRGNPMNTPLSDNWKMMLIGLGGDLYYTGFRTNPELITAANGYWLVPNAPCLPR